MEDDEFYASGGNFHKPRREHIEKIAGEGKQIVEVMPIAETTSNILTGKSVDTYQADGDPKSSWTTRGYEQQTYGHEDFVAHTPSLPHLKAMLTRRLMAMWWHSMIAVVHSTRHP